MEFFNMVPDWLFGLIALALLGIGILLLCMKAEESTRRAFVEMFRCDPESEESADRVFDKLCQMTWECRKIAAKHGSGDQKWTKACDALAEAENLARWAGHEKEVQRYEKWREGATA